MTPAPAQNSKRKRKRSGRARKRRYAGGPGWRAPRCHFRRRETWPRAETAGTWLPGNSCSYFQVNAGGAWAGSAQGGGGARLLPGSAPVREVLRVRAGIRRRTLCCISWSRVPPGGNSKHGSGVRERAGSLECCCGFSYPGCRGQPWLRDSAAPGCYRVLSV